MSSQYDLEQGRVSAVRSLTVPVASTLAVRVRGVDVSLERPIVHADYCLCAFDKVSRFRRVNSMFHLFS